MDVAVFCEDLCRFVTGTFLAGDCFDFAGSLLSSDNVKGDEGDPKEVRVPLTELDCFLRAEGEFKGGLALACERLSFRSGEGGLSEFAETLGLIDSVDIGTGPVGRSDGPYVPSKMACPAAIYLLVM